MVSASDVVLEYVCPILGITMANIMFGAPVKAVQDAVKRGHLGDLNPTPWAFMTGNCLGWVAYSFLIGNVFVLFGNAPGLLLSVWLNLCAAKLQYQSHKATEMRQSFVSFLHQQHGTTTNNKGTKNNDDDDDDEVEQPQSTATTTTRPRSHAELVKLVLDVTTQQTPAPAPHEKIVLSIVSVWLAVFCFVAFANDTVVSQSTKELVVGVIVNINLLFFYGAPLSTIYTVLQTQSTASIHFWTMATNTANGAFWTAYGLALLDPIILVPNGIGVVLGLIQVVLYVVFPNKKQSDNDEDNESENKGKMMKGTLTRLDGGVEENDQAELGMSHQEEEKDEGNVGTGP